MSYIRPWALWRRLQYIVGFLLLSISIGVVIYFANFYEKANCFDKILNGDEVGVDCGGGCVQVCVADTLPPVVVWVESFLVTNNQYNAVAYIENPNQTVGTPSLGYTFQFFSNGEKIGERKGKTVLPPNSVYPIFEGRVFIDSDKPITETKIILDNTNSWLPSSVERSQFRSTDIRLSGADNEPRLNVEIENTDLVSADNVEIVATVFNDSGKPVTASQTFIEYIAPRSIQDVVFTWPNPIAKRVRNCVIPTDVAVAIDLSGSMNNDGDTPPQPVTKALEAAGQFISTLREKDKVALITFATEANVVSELTNLHSSVSNITVGLKIDPKEETGFTNTVGALKLVQYELNSERHNPDARRVLVLLTDGLPTKAGDDDVIAETELLAKQLNESGAEVYSIGLGENVDQQFIRNIASDFNNAYFAPTGEELTRIYTEITSSLCEVGPTKIDIIAKTKTNFAPLR